MSFQRIAVAISTLSSCVLQQITFVRVKTSEKSFPRLSPIVLGGVSHAGVVGSLLPAVIGEGSTKLSWPDSNNNVSVN